MMRLFLSLFPPPRVQSLPWPSRAVQLEADALRWWFRHQCLATALLALPMAMSHAPAAPAAAHQAEAPDRVWPSPGPNGGPRVDILRSSLFRKMPQSLVLSNRAALLEPILAVLPRAHPQQKVRRKKRPSCAAGSAPLCALVREIFTFWCVAQTAPPRPPKLETKSQMA